jgi:AcrR family transcriptional regulator
VDTKKRIVRNALKLFLEKGFYKVSMSMIAKETGISKPAIYHHFQNKDALVEGVLDHFTEKMKLWNMDYFNGAEKGKDVLQRMFSAIPIYKNVEHVLLDEIAGDYSFSFNELLITLSKHKPEFKERIARDISGGTAKIRESLEKIQQEEEVKDGIESDKLAIFVHAILEGSAILSELREDLDLTEISDDLFRIFWKLLTKQGEEL